MSRTGVDRMQPEPPRRWSDGAAEQSLLLGLLGLACSFIPIVGDWITLPLALAAIALGFVGLRRHKGGRAQHSIMAVLGIALGAGALSVVVVMLFATGHVG